MSAPLSNYGGISGIWLGSTLPPIGEQGVLYVIAPGDGTIAPLTVWSGTTLPPVGVPGTIYALASATDAVDFEQNTILNTYNVATSSYTTALPYLWYDGEYIAPQAMATYSVAAGAYQFLYSNLDAIYTNLNNSIYLLSRQGATSYVQLDTAGWVANVTATTCAGGIGYALGDSAFFDLGTAALTAGANPATLATPIGLYSTAQQAAVDGPYYYFSNFPDAPCAQMFATNPVLAVQNLSLLSGLAGAICNATIASGSTSSVYAASIDTYGALYYFTTGTASTGVVANLGNAYPVVTLAVLESAVGTPSNVAFVEQNAPDNLTMLQVASPTQSAVAAVTIGAEITGACYNVNGDLYVSANSTLYLVPAGTTTAQVFASGLPDIANISLNAAAGVIYGVAASAGNSPTVYCVTITGAAEVSAELQYAPPVNCVAADGYGSLYLYSTASLAVLAYNQSVGHATVYASNIGAPVSGMACDAAGRLYLSSPEGILLAENGSATLLAGSPVVTALAISPSGTFYGVSAATNTIVSWDGVTLTTLPFTSALKTPVAVAVDVTGAVYVLDSGTPAVYKLAGATQTTLYSGATYLTAPVIGLLVDAAGLVWVAIQGGARWTSITGTTPTLYFPTGGATTVTSVTLGAIPSL